MTVPSIAPACKIGINGFGRIGRCVLRASFERSDVEVVAINHTAPNLETLLHVIKYDSTHGLCRQASELSIEGDKLLFRGRAIHLTSERDVSKLDWSLSGAEYVLEATGRATTVAAAERHVTLAKAKKVIITAPSSDAPTIVVGVNRLKYRPEMLVVSNASCTTNCLAPLAKVLDVNFGIISGMMTTVHASTSSNVILDGYHKKSKRLGRAVQANIIPTTTGAASAVQLVLPELAGKFTGVSVRVPVNNVSMVDLTVNLATGVTKEELLRPLREAAEGRSKNAAGSLANVIAVNDDELVSSDFIGWQQSCIVDSKATCLLNPNLAKILAFYDNEFAFSVRLLDLAIFMYQTDRNAGLA